MGLYLKEEGGAGNWVIREIATHRRVVVGRWKITVRNLWGVGEGVNYTEEEQEEEEEEEPKLFQKVSSVAGRGFAFVVPTNNHGGKHRRKKKNENK